ncbi:MAG TPA: universal stress protein [Actinomycetospora sp.]|uniref:universal stress protein n=1 Tax=Actinomycetospora sp. TaxID=1872135 RepID=UPI002F402107
MSTGGPAGKVLVRAPDDAAVLAVARAAAATVGAELRPAATADGHALARELDRPGVLTVVSRADDVGWALVAEAGKPVLLVPAAVVRVAARLDRVLAPLDGSPAAAASLAAAEAFLGGELVVLHVFDARAVPRFWDHPAHAERAWRHEFRARWCDRPGTRLELRTGDAPDRVLEVAHEEAADVVLLGWSQCLDPGRAALVRRTVAEADVPVLLVPTDGDVP